MNPALNLVLSLRLGMERGESLRAVIVQYSQDPSRPLAAEISEWLLAQEQNRSFELPRALSTPARQALLGILTRGLAGESVLQALQTLETEIFSQCLEHLEERTALLPFLALPPLLLLQFPALMILILLPLLDGFSGAF